LKIIIREEFMARAIWNRVGLAESDETIVVEGNHYFPPKNILSFPIPAGEKAWEG
jgi:uncharacterized protein (DUF427 family)